MSGQLTESVFDHFYDPFAIRRKKMLPIWIKVFCWIFLVVGIWAPASFLLGALGILNDGTYSIYGFTAIGALSPGGIGITILFMLKGIIAYGLLREQDWAIKYGQYEGYLSLVLCIISMVVGLFFSTYSFNGFIIKGFSFRIELVPLIPYLVKLRNIRDTWEANVFARQEALPKV